MVSMTRTLALAFLCASAACAQTAQHFVLVAHSGAGDYSQTPPNVIEARRDGMVKAVRADGKIEFASWSRTAEPVYVPAL